MVKKNIIHVLMSAYIVDSRVRNETVSLANAGYNVSVFCLKGKGLISKEEREGVKLIRFGLNFPRKFLFLTACFSMFFAVLNRKIDLVHAHDVNSLPMAYLISRVKKASLVYDSHELWSQSHHQKRSKFILYLAERVERILARRADSIITVSDGISSYLKKYLERDNVYTVRNIPSYLHEEEYNLLREEFDIPPNNLIFIYQGMISKSRGVDLLLKASLSFNNDDGVVFIFMGDGPFSEEVKEFIFNNNLKKVFYKSAVPQDQLMKYTKSADVGIHAIKNTCLNHDLCLPNKLFEYLNAGKPVIVTDLKEMSKFVCDNKVGLTFSDDDESSLVGAIKEISSNYELLETLKVSALAVSKNVNWSNESKILLNIYSDILC